MVKIVRQNTPTQSSQDKAARAEEIVKQLKHTSAEEAASRLAAVNGLQYIDLNIFPVDPNDVALLPEADSTRLGSVIFYRSGTTIHIGLTDPIRTDILEYFQKLGDDQGWQIIPFVISHASLEKVVALYRKSTLLESLDLMRVSLKGEELEHFEKDFGELLGLKTREVKDFPTSRLIEIILAGANKLEASDIHIEPEEETVRLRYRIDGVLQDVGVFPKSLYMLALSRIKMLAGMKINIRDRAQDGSFDIDLVGKRIDLRVNIIPGNNGESINMRLLDSTSVIVPVESLGLRGLAYEEVLKQSSKSHGMILNTGPTGSGKTTTLYSLLNKLNQPGEKIITIEDPVEYHLSGIVQTEVSKNGEYGFATALRAVVRQDPDIVLVGEIRDEETSDVAINAALTGHLVFSTLHANSAPAAIPRFFELGAKPSILPAAVNAIIAQRLVRVLCKDCKASYEPASETIGSLKRLISIISPKAKVDVPSDIPTLWKSVGCPKCRMTGYKGRIGIFEVLVMTPEITAAVEENGNERTILRVALENGMVTLTQDGILKALEGITSIEEVWRVADQRDVLKDIYTELSPSQFDNALTIPATMIAPLQEHLDDLSTFSTFIKTFKSDERLAAIFATSLILKAGDIHIEPEETDFVVRMRIDGILQNVARFPMNEYQAFIGEIKFLSGLKTSERAGIADSRLSLALEAPISEGGEAIVDVRVSIILGGYGETAVLRILSKASVLLNLATLGIRPYNLDRIIATLDQPYGLILTTGPTGSGKTTTLYSFLARLNKPEVKIITVEDPIEYRLPGLLQTQVNEEEGYTFSIALKSLLRQNPDIMMIGEIRDSDTASIAIQAASTGHLVLSTLHTNNAAGTVARLLNMDISGDDLANAASMFLAQRLVRKLCQACHAEAIPTEEEHLLINKILGTLPEKSTIRPAQTERIYHLKGCPKCNGTGYSGQMMLCETLLVDRDIEECIARGALTHEIEDTAVKNGMLTLAQDGILAVLDGLTTLDEVKRVTEE